jgi:hypothetical protein
MKLKPYSGEPCGAGNFPEEVFVPIDGIDMPMDMALTMDKKRMLLMDSVDYYQTKTLNKTEALALADYLRCLAELMEE